MHVSLERIYICFCQAVPLPPVLWDHLKLNSLLDAFLSHPGCGNSSHKYTAGLDYCEFAKEIISSYLLNIHV